MSQWIRIGYGFGGTVGLAVLAIIWVRVYTANLAPIVEAHAGPFSYVIGWMETIVPAVIVILLLALWVWVVAGPVQNERARGPVR